MTQKERIEQLEAEVERLREQIGQLSVALAQAVAQPQVVYVYPQPAPVLPNTPLPWSPTICQTGSATTPDWLKDCRIVNTTTAN